MSLAQEPGAFFYVLEEEVRILFADDDPILREFAVVHLSTDKAKVRTAADGIETLNAIEEEIPDILLLDLEMPGLDGFEVLERLRGDTRFRSLPILVVTGREDVFAIDKAFLAGATSFVVKPINWRLLSYQIRFLHRAAQTERSLDMARAKARSEAVAAAQAVRRLAKEGAQFLDVAIRSQPSLRSEAKPYIELIGELVPPALN